MEDQLKKKDDELDRVRNEERSRASALDQQLQQRSETQEKLERELAEASNLNESMQDDMDRMTNDHQAEIRRLREQIQDAQEAAQQATQQAAANSRSMRSNEGDAKLRQENESLRASLQDQQQATDEVRREAQQFLQEMKMLSEQHTPAFERHAELEKMVEQLEQEVRDWRNRYARTKTQLRNLRSKQRDEIHKVLVFHTRF